MRYFPDLAGETDMHLDLVRVRIRPYAWVYEYRLWTTTQSHWIIVKVPQPKTEPYFKGEHAALTAIQEHFGRLGDSRFGTVQVFDLLPDNSAVVMEAVRRPTLDKLLIRSNRLYRPFKAAPLGGMFRNAGAWLRFFHELPGVEDVKERMTGREDFLESIRQSTEYLTPAAGSERFFRRVTAETEAAARATLPEKLPLVLGHVDYAPHNIFVGPDDRVTVFDTLANRRVPPYKDLGYFLLALKLTPHHSYGFGLLFDPEAITGYEREFFNGYFGDDLVPLTAIRLFEIEAALKKWAQRVESHRKARGILSLAKGGRLVLRNAFYRSYVRNLVREVRECDTHPPAVEGHRV